MRVTLVIVGGKANKGRVSLSLPIVIGRGRDADLTVAHPMISRKHCELYDNGGLLAVRDLGSLNGTFVGGEQISEASLKPSDRFTIGPLTFRVDYDCHGDPQTRGVAAPAVHPPEQGQVEIPEDASEVERATEAPAADSSNRDHSEIPVGIADLNLALGPDADDEAPASAPLDETLQIDAQTAALPADSSPADSSPADGQIAIAPLDGLLPDVSAWAGAADQPISGPPADQPAPPIEPCAPPAPAEELPESTLEDSASEQDPDLDDFLRNLR